MKKLIFISFAAMALSINAQTVEKTFLFDFGGAGSPGDRGLITTEPGWNNIAPPGDSDQSIKQYSSFDLKDTNEDGTDGYKLTLTTAWGVNGNSGGGGLMDPDPDLLGDLALGTATGDYIFNTNNGDSGRSFVISGLDINKGYRFTIFGTRSANDVRKGNYILSGSNSWYTEMQVAGSGLGAKGENQNTDNAPVSDILFPDAAGKITLWIENPNTTYVPLSCMKMEQFSDAEKPAMEGTILRTFFFDFGSNVANRGAETEAPGWNNILANSGNDCSANTLFEPLVDSEGNETEMTLLVADKFTTNGLTTGQGLPSPSEELLGDLAIENATYDYFFVDQAIASGKIVIGGLDNSKSYRFHIFASRLAKDARLGAYRLEGLTDWMGAMQAAGNANDNETNSQNESVILVSDPVFPDSNGEISLTLVNGQKIYLPINCMKIEEIGEIERPKILTVVEAEISGEDIAEGETITLVNRGRNVFELYVKAAAGEYSINAKDDEENTIELPVTLSEGINRVTVNFTDNSITVSPVTYFCLQGSVWGGWSQTGQEMEYIGKGQWNFTGELKGYDKSSDSGRFNFLMNKQWDPAFKKVSGAYGQLAEGSGDDIPLNPGTYSITADLNNMTFAVENGLDKLDPYRITMMGSSVANGQGATQVDGYNTGYAYQYEKHLAERYENSESENPFYISNISINGNSSVDLLNRFDELERDFGKWVIYGISLGNEGIHETSDQQAVYDQWVDNMKTLIDKARELGKEVVVMNNYTRGDFEANDYEYVKRINAEIARWDVPSVNLLGAIDNGAGKWADGYQNGTDVYHPNTEGHTEFFYSMVPSLFDAMIEEKPLTMERTSDGAYQLPENTLVEFTPDGTVHSFTFALSAKASDGDIIATIPVAASETPVTITRTEGNIVVLLPDNTTLSVPLTSALSDEESVDVDEIEFSQNYIRKMVSLTVNGERVEETEFTPVSPLSVSVGNPEAENNIAVGEMMFYRSSMHDASPFTTDGKLNKSSLEVYVPSVEILENKAMSTVAVTSRKVESTGVDKAGGEASSFRAYSGAPGEINIFSPTPKKVNVVNMLGQTVASASVEGESVISGLASGIYIVGGKKIVVK